jgi:TonB family protein
MDLYAARVRFVIRRYYAARAQSCFDHATRNNPTLDGQVVVALTVGRDGNVTRSSVARNTTGDDALGRCLATQVRQWRFPVPPGGESLDMTMPFSR